MGEMAMDGVTIRTPVPTPELDRKMTISSITSAPKSDESQRSPTFPSEELSDDVKRTSSVISCRHQRIHFFLYALGALVIIALCVGIVCLKMEQNEMKRELKGN